MTYDEIVCVLLYSERTFSFSPFLSFCLLLFLFFSSLFTLFLSFKNCLPFIFSFSEHTSTCLPVKPGGMNVTQRLLLLPLILSRDAIIKAFEDRKELSQDVGVRSSV